MKTKLIWALLTWTFVVIAIAPHAAADPLLPKPKCNNPLTDIGSPCNTDHSWRVTINEIGNTEQGRVILRFFARNGTVQVSDKEDKNSDTLTFTDEIITLENGKKVQRTVVTVMSDPFDPPSPAESEEFSARNPFDQTNARYTIVSEAETPEPPTLFLQGAGLALWAMRRRLTGRLA